jgi:hypothetical protein
VFYYKVKFKNKDSGIDLQKKGLRSTPTYLQSEMTLRIDDYGKKYP